MQFWHVGYFLATLTIAYCGAFSPVHAGPEGSRITILYDAFGMPSPLIKDWGFSAFIEYDGKRILFDTGNNADIFAHNVNAKGIDLTDLDFAVVSHRHGDHTSGLNHLVAINPDVRIYAPKENFGVFGAVLPGSFYDREESLPEEMRYFEGSPNETLEFGSPWRNANFELITETTEIAPGFHLILLKGTWGVDLDVMEISLAIETPDGIVLVVGCSHPTIERIVEATRTAIGKPIHFVIGGTHLLPATPTQITRIGTDLRDKWNVAWIAPVHCTGEPAFAILQDLFADRYVYAGLGTNLELGPKIVVKADAVGPGRATMDDQDAQTYRMALAKAMLASLKDRQELGQVSTSGHSRYR